jgi:hypothetical protein
VVKKTTWQRWAPAGETIEAMRSALCSHWVAATHSAPHPYWPEPANWQHRQAYHFTSGGRLIR